MSGNAPEILVTSFFISGGRAYDAQVSRAAHYSKGDMMMLLQALSLYMDVCRPSRIAGNAVEEVFQAEEGRGQWKRASLEAGPQGRRTQMRRQPRQQIFLNGRTPKDRGKLVVPFLPGINL